jgi:hypothetical protein
MGLITPLHQGMGTTDTMGRGMQGLMGMVTILAGITNIAAINWALKPRVRLKKKDKARILILSSGVEAFKKTSP